MINYNYLVHLRATRAVAYSWQFEKRWFFVFFFSQLLGGTKGSHLWFTDGLQNETNG